MQPAAGDAAAEYWAAVLPLEEAHGVPGSYSAHSLLLSVVPEGAVLGATATLVPTTKGCGVITESLRAMGVKPQ